MENEKKEEGFSYTSPELQRKNALKVLGIEVIIILIIVVLIFFALSYFGIFKIGDLVKEFDISQQSPQSEITEITHSQPTIVTGGENKANISVYSQISGYEIILKNTQQFIDFMTKIGVWGYQPTTQGVIQPPIKSISIILTDKIQQNNQFKAEKTGIYMSADVDPQNGQVIVRAYLSPFILRQTESRRGEFLDQVVVTALYRVAHQSLAADTAQESNALKEIYSEMGAKNITLFDVKSK
jgi:hypothetical protein